MVAVGSDTETFEVQPAPDPGTPANPQPVHTLLLIENAIYLFESVYLEEISPRAGVRVPLRRAAAEDRGRHRLDARPGRDRLSVTSAGARPLCPGDEGGTVAEDAEQDQNILQRLISWRVGAAMEPHPPNETLMRLQQPFVDLLDKYYFRLEVDGWERVPDETCLVIGVHSGGALTMDAWTLVNAWQQALRGPSGPCTAPRTTCSWPRPGSATTSGPSASSPPTGRASARRWPSGEDVVVWPGGEVDAMRSWRKRDVATLGGRTGFVKQAIRSGVPIVPVATVGGHDTVFVLSEGKWLANALDKVLGLKKTLRGANLPIIAGFPFPHRRRDPAGARPAAGQDPHRAPRPDRGRRRPRPRRRRGLRAEDLRPGRGGDPGRAWTGWPPSGRCRSWAEPGLDGIPGLAGGATTDDGDGRSRAMARATSTRSRRSARACSAARCPATSWRRCSTTAPARAGSSRRSPPSR